MGSSIKKDKIEVADGELMASEQVHNNKLGVSSIQGRDIYGTDRQNSKYGSNVF